MKQSTLTDYESEVFRCEVCLEPFDSEMGASVHRGIVHGSDVTKKCLHCGETFTLKRWQDDNNGGQKYCSYSCSAQARNQSGENHPMWNGGEVDLICDQCNEEFSVTPARSDSARFCSTECNSQWKRENRYGSNHSCWKGGFKLVNAVRRSIGPGSWIIASQAQRERTDECAICQERPGTVAHHIVPIIAGGTHADELLMSVCPVCHPKAERIGRKVSEPYLSWEYYTD